MTAHEIIKGQSDAKLAEALFELSLEHLDRGRGHAIEIPTLLDLEDRIGKDGRMSKGMAILVTKKAILVEVAGRWLEGLKNEKG